METNAQSIWLSVVAFGLVGIALGYWVSTMTPTTAPEPIPINWETYQNREYKFKLQYPDNYSVLLGDLGDYPSGSTLPLDVNQATSPVLATFVLDESDYKFTNLAGAWVTVSAAYSMNEQVCETATDGLNVSDLPAERVTNGVTWHEFADGWTAEGAAGTKFESRTFHTAHNGGCYEVILHLATSNIGNYPPGTVSAVDEGTLRAQLQSIFHTFQFTD